VTADKVSTATISSTGLVTGKLDNGVAYTSQIPTALNDNAISPLLLTHRVQVTGTSSSSSSVASLLFSLWPLLLLVGVFVWFARRGRKQLGGIMSIGRSKAKLYDEQRPATRFADIAGYEGSKAEVMEVVDYLKHPQRYARAGAVGPKGVPSRDDPFAGRPYAEGTQRSIDQEVAKLLREAESRATMLLRHNLDTLTRVIDLLLERETIDGSDLAAIAGVPERPAQPEMVWAPRAVAMTPAEAEQGGTSAANRKAAPVS
jgi:ATP-dependent Zn protease